MVACRPPGSFSSTSGVWRGPGTRRAGRCRRRGCTRGTRRAGSPSRTRPPSPVRHSRLLCLHGQDLLVGHRHVEEDHVEHARPSRRRSRRWPGSCGRRSSCTVVAPVKTGITLLRPVVDHGAPEIAAAARMSPAPSTLRATVAERPSVGTDVDLDEAAEDDRARRDDRGLGEVDVADGAAVDGEVVPRPDRLELAGREPSGVGHAQSPLDAGHGRERGRPVVDDGHADVGADGLLAVDEEVRRARW